MKVFKFVIVLIIATVIAYAIADSMVDFITNTLKQEGLIK